jgi:type VI secretion system protein ImpM
MLGPPVEQAAPQGTGYFGKVAAFPEFVSRRLPRTFVEPWDAWLQQAMTSSRERLGVSWLDTYLVSPLWRFAFATGVCGATAWVGVCMPSVDKVGRHFPLTIAATAREPGLLTAMSESRWFEQVEQVALSTLDEPFDLDRFDEAVEQLALAASPQQVSGIARSMQNSAPAWCFSLSSMGDVTQCVPKIADYLLDAHLEGHSCWWTEGSAKVQPCALVCKGLPSAQIFAAFLDGNWARWGWSG